MLVVIPHMDIAIEGAVAPIGAAQACVEGLGDRCRDHVHRTSRGEGAILHLTTTLQYLYSVHTGCIGEVVGGRSGIGSGGC